MKPYKINGKVTSRLYHSDTAIRFGPPCVPGKVKRISWEALQTQVTLAEMLNAIFEHYEGIESAETFADIPVWIDDEPSTLDKWMEICDAHGALVRVGLPDEIDQRVTLSDWKDFPGLSQCTSILTYQGD